MSHHLLFEIGAEEIPPSYIEPALEQLEAGVREGLAERHLEFEGTRTFGAARRLTIEVTGLAERQPDRDEEVVGPNVKAAYDPQGNPTKALLGFCQGRGVDLSAVRRIVTAKGEYVAVTVHHVGKPAAEVVPPLLASVATRLQFPKSMRWLDDDTRFARPVRWLVALLDADVLPVKAFHLEAGRASQGHRFLSPGPVELAHAHEYLELLDRAHVLADHRERRARLESQRDALAREAGGKAVADDELTAIDTFLAEWPTAFLGSLDARYLDLPREVIVMALREHQRFFAVDDPASGKLLPKFVAVRDGDDRGLDTVRRGNEAVLAARLEDADFYWKTDLKRPLNVQIEALQGVVWMEGRGSLRDKAARLESLCEWLAGRLAPDAAKAARRAALLCKTDLTSEMIGSGKEYAALQGTIGSYYAARAGEPEDVCRAIAEHYQPRGAGEALPATDAGAVLAMADRLDHVAGAFVSAKVPTGSEDPLGVRRAGNGVIRILMEQSRHLDLYAATMESTRPLFAADPELAQAEIMKQLGDFWRSRIETALDERGAAYDVRDAALEARPPMPDGRTRPGWNDPSDALDRARALGLFRNDRRFEPLVVLFKRVDNILKATTESLTEPYDRGVLRDPAEIRLIAALDRARSDSDPLWEKRDYAGVLNALLGMEEPIHHFFDHVLVNAEEQRLRVNRLRLLAAVRGMFLRGWDLSRVVVGAEEGAVAGVQRSG